MTTRANILTERLLIPHPDGGAMGAYRTRPAGA